MYNNYIWFCFFYATGLQVNYKVISKFITVEFYK